MPARPLRVLLIAIKSTMARALMDRPELDVTILSNDDHRAEFEEFGCGDALSDLPYVKGDKLSPWSIRSVRRAIDELQPDLIHAFYPRALAHTVVAVAGMRDRPRIVSYRGVTAPAPWWSPVQRLTYRSGRVDMHACESTAVRDSLVVSGVPAERCGVVYNCLNGPLWRVDRTAARETWGVPADAFVVALAANMRPVKGADVLVRAAQQCTDLRDVHFVLMGRVHDSRVTTLADDARLRGRLHLIGFTPDAPRLVSAADVFVMPSRAEALSVALLEAMGQGVCPVVSDAGGMKEAVRDGVDGLVFPSGDPRALAQAIRRLKGDEPLRTQLGASAARRIADEFSAAAIAARLAKLYQQAVGATSGLSRAA